MNKRASIDIGSNTTLLLVANVIDGNIEEIETRERVTALGRELDQTKKIHLQAMKDTFDALKDYREIIEKHGLPIEETVVTATEAARVATNAQVFFREVCEKIGFRIHIITAAGEAYYALQGVVQEKNGSFVVVDIGGASTELIKVSEGSLERTISLPVGSVRGTDWMKEGHFQRTFGEYFFEGANYDSLF